MSTSRDIRRCALQALYQFDCHQDSSPETVRVSLAGSPGGDQVHDQGFALACSAWAMRHEADRAVEALAPQWPTYRQPVVDRSILRLAFYEMRSGRTPPKVAINEAVELAKEFSTERSPMFINGVLDKLYRQLRGVEEAGAADTTGPPPIDAPTDASDPDIPHPAEPHPLNPEP